MIEYFTKRRAPNNTEYHFTLTSWDAITSFITVTRITKWYLPDEEILKRRMSNNLEALKFFQSLLDSFPRDQLYKE